MDHCTSRLALIVLGFPNIPPFSGRKNRGWKWGFQDCGIRNFDLVRNFRPCKSLSGGFGHEKALVARCNDFSSDLHSFVNQFQQLSVGPAPVCIQNNFVWNGKPVMLDNSKGLWHKEIPQLQYFKPGLYVICMLCSTKLYSTRSLWSLWMVWIVCYSQRK